MPIETPQDLREHIELAIQVEMSTIPPYLFAMYSIKDQSSEPALLIRSIVAEEMLHAALASNLLLAVGGTPDYASTAYMPSYPSELPHHQPPLVVELRPCSLELIRDLFMRIEQPEAHGAPAQPDEFETLGQFYHALEIGLTEISQAHDLFADPQRSAQLSDPRFYSPVAFDAEDSGGLMLVDDLASGIDAIEIIVHQGEGLSDEKWADPSHQELTHYHKLLQITDGISPLGEVRPLRANPRTSGYPAELRLVSELFNACYRYVFLVMHDLFTDGTNQEKGVDDLYQLMTGVLSPAALYLAAQPLGDGDFAGPTFEPFEFATQDPLAELARMSEAVAAAHSALAPIHDSLASLGGD